MAFTLDAAAARLTRNINANEAAVGNAIAATSETIATLSLAQIEVADAPKGEVQIAMTRLQKASANIIAAQAEILRAHQQLREIGREMMGPAEPWCPEDKSFTGAQLDVEDVAA